MKYFNFQTGRVEGAGSSQLAKRSMTSLQGFELEQTTSRSGPSERHPAAAAAPQQNALVRVLQPWQLELARQARGAVRARVARLTAPNLVPYSTTSQKKEDEVPYWLSRSGLACWWSCRKLFSQGPVYFWTFTTQECMPDFYYGNLRQKLLRCLFHSEREGRIPKNWGGVRCIEPHPNGHGLHDHWLLNCRLWVGEVRHLAKQAGWGRIHVRRAFGWEANYLSKYVTKKACLSGLKRWSCIGHFDGLKVNDLEIETGEIIRTKYHLRKLENEVPEMKPFLRYQLASGIAQRELTTWQP